MRELINNLITIATVTATKTSEGKALAKVKIGDRQSDFYPVLGFANSFKRHFCPVRVGEQVLVFSPFGDASSGVIVGSIFFNGTNEPASSSDTKEISQYEDGTIISYDSSSSTLEILNPKTLNLAIQNDINITCKSANITATDTNITSPNVTIKGNTTIQGAINTAGSGGGAGSITMNGTLSLSGDLVVGGNISDSRGDLTGHSHSDTDGYTSSPR